ncbi:hypothetical protein COOONC_00277 [Cooperia oncophora]
MAHLKGTAKAVFESFSTEEKQNWQIATTKLKQHFTTDHFSDIARVKLMICVWNLRIRRKILEAYPNSRLTGERKFLQTMVFINALSYPLKQRLKLSGHLPTNYEKLIQDAERIGIFTQSDTDSIRF